MRVANILQLFVYMLINLTVWGQSNDFRSFIEKNGEKINDFPEQCENFFGTAPFTNDDEAGYYKVLLIRENFVGILFTIEQFDAHNETTTTLSTYDWNGNFIDKLDYGYAVGGDFYSKSLTCELSKDDMINCTDAEHEGTLKENLDEEGNVISMDYVAVRDDITKSRYKINADGTFEEIVITDE